MRLPESLGTGTTSWPTGSPSSQLAAERLGPLMQPTVPTPATAAELASSITLLHSNDGTNINGAILASDGGWSAL
ncbi:hypothetical protein [Arthrobacter sp. 9MFCol3.1]|uniref:hypothetical protein n=1 Tax=Arthrobacter sp. 9MFCol3.1 TaxID=1150398 RepID=UPI003FA48FCF